MASGAPWRSRGRLSGPCLGRVGGAIGGRAAKRRRREAITTIPQFPTIPPWRRPAKPGLGSLRAPPRDAWCERLVASPPIGPKRRHRRPMQVRCPGTRESRRCSRNDGTTYRLLPSPLLNRGISCPFQKCSEGAVTLVGQSRVMFGTPGTPVSRWRVAALGLRRRRGQASGRRIVMRNPHVLRFSATTVPPMAMTFRRTIERPIPKWAFPGALAQLGLFET